MDELTQVLGILGAYFTVLLVLAVSVESILEPISWFKGLRKKITPDEALKDLKEWMPANGDENDKAIASANAIANMNMEYKVVLTDITARAEEIKAIAAELAQGLGVEGPVNDLQTKMAVNMAALRAKYALTERTRITILRILSAAIGVVIAIFLKINTFEILSSLFSAEINTLFSSPVAQVGGMVLTGFAASAGSSFWHDILGKMRAVKEAANQLQDVPVRR